MAAAQHFSNDLICFTHYYTSRSVRNILLFLLCWAWWDQRVCLAERRTGGVHGRCAEWRRCCGRSGGLFLGVAALLRLVLRKTVGGPPAAACRVLLRSGRLRRVSLSSFGFCWSQRSSLLPVAPLPISILPFPYSLCSSGRRGALAGAFTIARWKKTWFF